jgi:hypothetical protein
MKFKYKDQIVTASSKVEAIKKLKTPTFGIFLGKPVSPSYIIKQGYDRSSLLKVIKIMSHASVIIKKITGNTNSIRIIKESKYGTTVIISEIIPNRVGFIFEFLDSMNRPTDDNTLYLQIDNMTESVCYPLFNITDAKIVRTVKDINKKISEKEIDDVLDEVEEKHRRKGIVDKESGLTLDKLHTLFDKVKNKKDWKGKIATTITVKDREELNNILYSITYFTGDQMPDFYEISKNRYRIKSVGYRQGTDENYLFNSGITL